MYLGKAIKHTAKRQEEIPHPNPTNAGTWMETSSLQDCEKINFCCLIMVYFMVAPAD
jgi:hypothetical protein